VIGVSLERSGLSTTRVGLVFTAMLAGRDRHLPGRDQRRPRRVVTCSIWMCEAPDGETVILGQHEYPEGGE
jgi:hypothetical protein